MTSRVRTSIYKGASITVRWQELKRTTPPGSLFIAGYTITSGDGRHVDRREFETPTFHTHDTAVAYALAEAHRFMDAQHSVSANRLDPTKRRPVEPLQLGLSSTKPAPDAAERLARTRRPNRVTG